MEVKMSVFILTLILMVGGVHAQTPAPADKKVTPAAPKASAEPKLDKNFQEMLSAGESIFLYLQPYNYDSEARRDPFKAFQVEADTEEADNELNDTNNDNDAVGAILSLRQYELSRLKLVGVMWDVENPKVLVTDPAGRMHVLSRNDRLGERNGYIAAIRENEVVVVQSSKDKEGKKKYEAKVITLK